MQRHSGLRIDEMDRDAMVYQHLRISPFRTTMMGHRTGISPFRTTIMGHRTAFPMRTVEQDTSLPTSTVQPTIAYPISSIALEQLEQIRLFTQSQEWRDMRQQLHDRLQSIMQIGVRIRNSREHRLNTPIVFDDIAFQPHELNCCICMEDKTNPQMNKLNCNHIFCGECIQKLNSWSCPLCRTPITCLHTNKP